MRVICTGISGTDRLGWLREASARAAGEPWGMAVYDVNEAMSLIARDVGQPVDEETVLDMFPRALVMLRAVALEQTCAQMDARGASDWVLNTHAVFRWRNALISGFDPHYLERLEPDLFLTITDGAPATLRRLRQQPRWRYHRIEDVLTWREEEELLSEEMARIHRKPHYLVPRALAPEHMARLLVDQGWKRAYLSYPMQHVPPGERGLAAFKTQLQDRLVVFDPGDVNDFGTPGSADAADLASDEPSPLPDHIRQHVADQIVARDYKLIDQSDVVVVFYDVAVPSPGVISEMKLGLESGKRVYGVWLPQSEPSVFFTRYCSAWFHSTRDLLTHLDGTLDAPREEAHRWAPSDLHQADPRSA